MVKSLQYLARVILLVDDHWLAMVRNVSWARAVWKRTTRTLIREGGGATVVCILFLICVTGGVAIRLGDLGGHPPYGMVPVGGSTTRW